MFLNKETKKKKNSKKEEPIYKHLEVRYVVIPKQENI